jgi:hypothetical protein
MRIAGDGPAPRYRNGPRTAGGKSIDPVRPGRCNRRERRLVSDGCSPNYLRDQQDLVREPGYNIGGGAMTEWRMRRKKGARGGRRGASRGSRAERPEPRLRSWQAAGASRSTGAARVAVRKVASSPVTDVEVTSSKNPLAGSRRECAACLACRDRSSDRQSTTLESPFDQRVRIESASL